MKRTVAFGLLLVFCFTQIRPLLPFAEYILKYEFISEVLCINKNIPESSCNGKCHLVKQLKKVDDNQQKDIPKSLTQKIEILLYFNQENNYLKESLLMALNAREFFERPSLYVSSYLDKPFHPPKTHFGLID